MSALPAMSGSLPTIFSFEGSKKWIIREGVNGTSSSGSGAPQGERASRSRGGCAKVVSGVGGGELDRQTRGEHGWRFSQTAHILGSGQDRGAELNPEQGTDGLEDVRRELARAR